MCTKVDITTKEGFLSTSDYPANIPQTDNNCSCTIQPKGGTVTVKILQMAYGSSKGESGRGFNLTSTVKEMPQTLYGARNGDLFNTTLANQTTNAVELLMLNEGVAYGKLWIHFEGL